MCLCFCDCILVLLAVLFPPLPVWIKRGLCSADSLINILLCCLGYFPGLIHSWYIISRYPEDEYIIFDEEAQVYVSPSSRSTTTHNHHHHHHQHTYTVTSPTLSASSGPEHNNNNNNVNYGSTTDQPDQSIPQDAPPAYDNVMTETRPTK